MGFVVEVATLSSFGETEKYLEKADALDCPPSYSGLRIDSRIPWHVLPLFPSTVESLGDASVFYYKLPPSSVSVLSWKSCVSHPLCPYLS